jgi:hypothetical protein
MDQILQFAGGFAILFVGALALGFLVTRILSRPIPLPATGSIVLIRSRSGVSRAKMQTSAKQGWTLSAPIAREEQGLPEVGETVTLEAASTFGVAVYRAEVLATEGNLTLGPPSWSTFRERREDPRIREPLIGAMVDGETADVENISRGGAQIIVGGTLRRGERVRVDLAGKAPAFGWVLDSVCSGGACRVRVRFEEPFNVRGLVPRRTI